MTRTTRGIAALAGSAALAAALGLGIAVASDDGAKGLDLGTLGTTAEAITASLAEQGFEIRKVEQDDGELEAHAVKDGKRYEIYVDPATGQVSKIEQED